MPDTAPQQPARQELEKSAAIENPDPLLASIQAATAYKYRGQAGLSPAPSMSHDPSHQLTPSPNGARHVSTPPPAAGLGPRQR